MQIVGIFFVVILTKLLNKLDCGRFEGHGAHVTSL